jgi:hypothetical protein
MKTKQKLFGFAISFVAISLALTLSMSGCKKDPVNNNPGIADVITIPGATLKSGNMPSGGESGPEISDFSGNSYVLAGGSNAITINTDETSVDYALVGVEGISGYYEVPVTVGKSSELTIVIYIYIEQDVTLESFTIILALMNGSNVGYHQTLGVNLVEAGTGKLQVSLSWDKESDVDLYLVEPNGTTIYYGNPNSTNGGNLDVDSNAGCSIDGIKNENITYGDESIVEAGLYIVRVNLWAVCSVTEQINYTAIARLDGSVITPSWGNNPKNGFYPAGSSGAGGGEEAGQEIMKFNVSASKIANAQTYARFTFPNQKNKVMPNTK